MYRFIISMVMVLVLFSVSFVFEGNAAGILNVGNPPSAEEQEKLAKAEAAIEKLETYLGIKNRLTVLHQDIETCVNIKRMDALLDIETDYCRKLAKEYLQLVEKRDEIEQQ